MHVDDVLIKTKDMINSRIGIVTELFKSNNYNDEPKFITYVSKVPNVSVFMNVMRGDKLQGGMSLDENEAKMKALGEAIERYSLGMYNEAEFKIASYKDVKDVAVDPKKFCYFTEEQLKRDEFKNFRFDENSIFKWKKAFLITENREILVPAQIVHVPYVYKNEPVIMLPITTGVALSTCMSGAIYRGICEIIERDAFMINYLNKLPREEIDLESIEDKRIKKILEMVKRYDLELHVFDITTDIKIPAVMTILIDRSSIGPFVSVGLNAELDPIKAVLGSIYEAHYTRPWMRSIKYKFGDKNIDNIRSIEDRGLYWYKKSMIDKLDFIIKSGKKKKFEDIENLSTESSINNLKTALNFLKERKMTVIVADATTPDVKSLGFNVVKVMIPEMEPLYLDEKYRHLKNDRLRTVPKTLEYKSLKVLNEVPHPFL